MKITKLTATVEATFNLGDYQNIKPHYSVEAELDENDDIEDARAKLSDMIYGWILADAQRTLKRKVTPILPFIEGLEPSAQAQLKKALPALAVVMTLDDSLPTETPTPLDPVRNTNNKVRVGGQRPKSPFDRPEKTEEKETSNAN